MVETAIVENYTAEYEAWFDKYLEVYESELLALKWELKQLPEGSRGMQVALGTGRFAAPLGIKEGVEQAKDMREIAVERGLEVMDAPAEQLPYRDLLFDFVLFVTICHLDDVRAALKEAYRVLKNSGSVIIGFIDQESRLGKKYEEKRHENTFYRHARFYTVDHVIDLLKEMEFKEFVFSQTIFHDLDDIEEAEMPREGYGEGSFIVVRARK